MENATYLPFWAFLRLFACPTLRGRIVSLTSYKIIILSNKHISIESFKRTLPHPFHLKPTF